MQIVFCNFSCFVITLLVLFSSISSSGQEVGKLIIEVEPLSAEVSLDGNLVQNQDTLNLDAGKHYLSANLYNYRPLQDTIEVFPDSTVFYKRHLYYEQDQAEKERIKGNAILSISKITAAGVVTYALAISDIIAVVDNQKVNSELANLEADIATQKELVETAEDSDVINEARENYQILVEEYNEVVKNHNDEVDRALRKNITTAAIGGALVYLGVKLHVRSRRKKKNSTTFSPVIRNTNNNYEFGFTFNF